jgi:hypothetical protein
MDMILTILFLIIFSLLIAIWILYLRYMKSENEIYRKYHLQTNWDLLSDSTNCGDEIGDNFLKEVGPVQIYQSEDIFALAASSGPAGKAFLDQFKTRPNWIDFDLVRKGSEFQRRWIEIYFGAALGSIIESYGYSNGANILIETGRLTCGTDSRRRLLETAIFNYDVIEYGFDSFTSPAYETIARVRLLHCMVRKHVIQSCPWWDIATMGVPVSQEDGAHTIFLNSHVAIRGMENQGLPLTLEEKNAISMFWSYCGYLLGIDERFLPRSYDQEVLYYETIFDHAFAPSEKSYQLIEASIQGAVDLPPYHFTSQQQTTLARLSLGTKLSDRLRLSSSSHLSDLLLVSLVRFVTLSQWALFQVTGWKYSFVSFLRRCLLLSLEQHGKGAPKWRFVVTKKKTKEAMAAM